jgi:hypothetical protein
MGAGAKPTDLEASLLPKEVGARLRQLRLQAGLNQTDVVLRMGRPGPCGESYGRELQADSGCRLPRTLLVRMPSMAVLRVELCLSKPIAR